MAYHLEHVERLADRWQSVAEPMLRADHCIYAARVLTDLLLSDSDPLVLVMDAVAENRLAHQIGTTDRNGNLKPGTWTVGVQSTDKVQHGGYRGHLVVLAKVALPDGSEGARLLDMSAPQFDRPAHGIRVRRPLVIDPAATGEPSRILPGFAFDLTALNAGVGWMNYAIQKHPDDYRHAANWRNPVGIERFHELWDTIASEPLTPRQHTG